MHVIKNLIITELLKTKLQQKQIDYSSAKFYENKVVNSIQESWIHWMQLTIYIHYWLLFFKNDNFKYRPTSQRRSFNSFSLFYILFYLIVFFFIFSCRILIHKETSNFQSILHIGYFEFLLCNALYSVGNMYW